MNNKFLIATAVALILASCSKVPITNRKQVNLLPESQMISMSLTQYKEFLKQNPPEPASDPDQQLVQRVGQRISAAD